MAVSRAHGRWTWIALGTALATCALFLVGGERLGVAWERLTRATPTETTGAPLHGSATAPASDTGPVLHGAPRSESREGEPAHGPVTVTVLDEADVPVVGACVRVDVAAATGTQGERLAVLEAQRTVAEGEHVTDRSGRVSFTDLPYDGTAEAFVVAQSVGEGDTVRAASAFGVARGAQYLISRGSETLSFVPPPEGSSLTGNGRREVLTPLVGGRSGFGAVLGGWARTRVTGSEVTLHMPRGLPFEVDLRAAESGRPLSARWQVTPRLEWAGEALESARVPVPPSQAALIQVKADPPRGRVVPSAEPWSVWIHPQAARLRAVVPLRAEADIVAVFPAKVLPFREEAWEATIRVGGTHIPAAVAHLGRDGRARILGVPHEVGSVITLDGPLAGRWQVQGKGTLGADPREPLVVEVACEPVAEPEDPLVFVISLGSIDHIAGNNLAQLFATEWTTTPLVEGGFVVVESGTPDVASGTVRVRVRAPSGSPASGASVQWDGGTAITDHEGLAILKPARVGSHQVLVGGAGATRTATVEVRNRETTDVDVRTTEGGTLDVSVVDALDRELPFATLTVTQASGFPWIDLVDGVQRIDPYTDERGRRTLTRVEVGNVKVKATYGSRSVEAEVEVEEGGRARVRLVLPAADASARATPPAEKAPAAAEESPAR